MATLEFSQAEVQLPEHAVQPGAKPGSWLQVLPHLEPKYGGLSAVVPRLAHQLAEQEGLDVHVAAFCSPDEALFAQRQQISGLSVWPLSRSTWALTPALRRRFRTLVRSANGVHIHGLWENSTLSAAFAAQEAGLPYVLSAHGMLERWALANKRWKKTLYSALFEHRNVRNAACMHALTHAEAEDYRRFGYKGPIAVIPNGVEAERFATASPFVAQYPAARGKRVVLFLGRIHYKKGVDLLVRAWAQVAEQYPDTLLVLAGPDSENTLEAIQRSVEESGLRDRVLFTGMLHAEMKWSALAAADYFVLPSHSEGLSVAALEALSMGVPLILSEQCNLPEVARANAGWQVTTDEQSIASALRAALDATADEREVRSRAATRLADREFGWDNVTRRMASVYEWLLNGAAPRNVEVLEAVR